MENDQNSLVSIFEKTRETKNTFLFTEVSARHGDLDIEKVFRTVYIQKDAFEGFGDPANINKIKITVEKA